MAVKGKVSWFGGPSDTGVSPDEGLAFIYEYEDAPHLFLEQQPPGTTGLARRLNPKVHYVACRWDYGITSKSFLLDNKVIVHAPSTGKQFEAYPADWGPHQDTGRIADISSGLMDALGIATDDVVEVLFPFKSPLAFERVVISSGHGKKVSGASGYIVEVTEARRVVEAVAEYLRQIGVEVTVFHDDTSTSQNQNLSTIVAAHNKVKPEHLDVSVHFNAHHTTSSPMGTECWYVTQKELAANISRAMANAGRLKDRGPKHSSELYFLNNTANVAVLLEVCFVDSSADTTLYQTHFDGICREIAATVSGQPVEAGVAAEGS